MTFASLFNSRQINVFFPTHRYHNSFFNSITNSLIFWTIEHQTFIVFHGWPTVFPGKNLHNYLAHKMKQICCENNFSVWKVLSRFHQLKMHSRVFSNIKYMHCTLLFNSIINFGNTRNSKSIRFTRALRWNYLL